MQYHLVWGCVALAMDKVEPRNEPEIGRKSIGREGHLETHRQCLLEENELDLLVRQGQCPKYANRMQCGKLCKVRSRWSRDLVDEYLPELKLLTVIAVSAMTAGLCIHRQVPLTSFPGGCRWAHIHSEGGGPLTL